MVHQYKLNGYNIVLDTASGSVHTVDEVAYDIIEMYESHSAEEIVATILERYKHLPDVNESEVLECIDDITALKEAGKLFSVDEYEGLACNYKNNSKVIKALCLHVAHTCNLNCSYCFASQGKYQGDRALMSFEVGKRAFDFLIENSGTRHNLEVDFFGGEPLMNWDVVKQLVAYARSIEKQHNKNFRFTLTTNGILIDDEVIDFLNKEMSNVVLSLDGRKEVNDHFRRDYAGNGSYDKIVPKFKKLVEARGGKDYYVRGTFTHNNVDFTNDIFHMADLGFTELSMEPVVCPPDDPYALTDEDMPKIFEQYEILAKEMLKRKKEGRPFTFYHYMLDLKNGPASTRELRVAAREPNIWQLPPGASFSPAISSSETPSTASATYLTELPTPKFRTASAPATPTRVPNARTAGQDFTALAAVPLIPITLREASMEFISTAVSFSRSVSSAR